jgi:hypothetical protein
MRLIALLFAATGLLVAACGGGSADDDGPQKAIPPLQCQNSPQVCA